MNRKNFDKILITGSQGFIGSHLLERFLSSKNVTGINKVQDKKRVGYLPLKKDITKLSTQEIKGKFKAVIHLAAITDAGYCNDNPEKCCLTNIFGTQKILEIARKNDCQLIYLSTSHVYGKPSRLPIKEEDPKNPASIYATSKLAGEICCEGYARTYGMDISIARIFSVYGPRSPPFLVTSRIITQLKKKSIQVGNLHPKRDFIFVADVVNAIETILKKSKGLRSYNVGTGHSHSVLEICNILRKISGRTIPIKSIKKYARKDEVNNIVSDPSKVKKLGWRPTIDLKRGLELTFNWYKHQTVS